ncbi:ABC-type multidrug transport system fused ATPase/permease subunit [Lentzea atacamensis]|uniref:ABC-type multidrug transport system fused ATPase/permease subunit n=1 Tax=Lentzea atacamensis TaxID=531938 RepID=A0ABX9E2J6_9PSEU|nr:ABC transporter ATP-binding protein [Lentzea atacamensis]RAS62600.1 ABC-type multidrug transport system fused ATPase/permease subunit [Lentzea atacamensis]
MRTPIDRPAWRTLLGHVRPHRRTVLLGGTLVLLGGLAAAAQPLAAKALVDRLGTGDAITGLLALLVGLALAGAAIAMAGDYLLERAAESVVLVARKRLTRKLLSLRVPAVQRAEPGDLLSRFTSDTTLLREVCTSALVGLVTGAVTTVVMVVMMGVMDLALLGVTLAVLAVVGLFAGAGLPMIEKASRAAQSAVGDTGARLERVLGSFRTVKAAGAETGEIAAIERGAEDAWRAGVRSARWESLVHGSNTLAVQAAFLAVLGIGGARVATGAISLSTLVAFLLFLFYLNEPIGQLLHAGSSLSVGLAAVRRLAEVEEMRSEPAGVAGARTGSAAKDGIRLAFEDVRFRYGPELPEVLRGIGVDVPATGMTAFVGPSGAGKSTLFALVERFYEPSAGRILLDGRDLAEWDLASLRAGVGYVEQDAPMLSGTLRDNLVYGRPDATDEEIRDVVAQTRLDSLVERLPEGLDTAVGHRGNFLSGGERQRIALARALIRRPRLLLLDEITSQLDAANEMAIRDVVTAAAKTMTVLVVAHRLSTVTQAERIVVVDNGKVRASGTHDELVASDPLYAGFAATQLLTGERE